MSRGGGKKVYLPSHVVHSDTEEPRVNSKTPRARKIGANANGDPEKQEAWEVSAAARSYGVRGLLRSMTITGIIVMLFLFANYAVVFLNFTFTFETQFPQETVPFYTAPESGALRRHSTRYELWWWLLTMTLLRMVSVFGTLAALAGAATTGGNGGIVFMKAWILIYGTYELITFAFYFIVSVFVGQCAMVPFCRSWDAAPLDKSEVAGVANWTFLFLTWFTFVFSIIHIVFFHWLRTADKRLDEIKAEGQVDNEDKRF